MPTILIAGAGHGGLSAAKRLAEAGCDVHIYEKCSRSTIGHDWADYIPINALAENGFTPIPHEKLAPCYPMCFVSPMKAITAGPPDRKRLVPHGVHAGRRDIAASMIADCEAAGVHFHFGCAILQPLAEGKRIKGFSYTDESGQTAEVRGDMVIDAAGAFSPIRMQLPKECRVPKKYGKYQVMYAWRGVFNRLPGEPESMIDIYLYHRNRRGISWVMTEPAYMDVLLSAMDRPITEEEIEEALTDLRESNPRIGKTRLQGGYQAPLPLRRPLARFVCDGYCAVGDSACFCGPLDGCGIRAAIRQGQILAEVLLQAAGDYSVEKLWQYQLRSLEELDTARRCREDRMRQMLMRLKPAQVELLFQSGLIGHRRLRKPRDGIKLLTDYPKLLALLPRFAAMLLKTRVLKLCLQHFPKHYPHRPNLWQSIYEKS
ncbi:MAG: NAD(P)/FAD-dependent oxidoreductase [Oscillospiraceae bacterium]|jgi:flavin-dependent dehydrogenase|nr:NAD(P)/FAD-dependent oxidoreductase [Oscillospiraceae bacterium]